ncbi:MAG: sugar isomerase [Clostridia bacterium]|nr:sugar isomerase [Clostridia bacterium]
MNNKKKILLNIFYSILSQTITILLGLLVPRLFIVGYGSETNGLLNSINQLLIYLGLFEAGIGISSLQALYGPVALDKKEDINAVLSATNLYYKKTGIYYFFGLIIFSATYPLFAKSKLEYISVFLIVFFSGISNVVLFFFQGKYKILLQAEGKNHIITNLTTIITILTNVSKIILLSLKVNVTFVILVSSIVGLIQAVYISLYIKCKYKWIDLKTKPNTKAIAQKNFVLVHQISGMVFSNTDVLILTIACDLKVVSVYSMYKLVITHIESIIAIISNSFSFSLGQSYQTDINRYKKEIDAYESFYSFIALSLFSVAFYLLKPFMKIYTAGVNDINYADDKLVFLFIVIAVLTALRTPMLYTINYAGHFKLTTPQTVIETIINIVISLVGVYFIGIYGVLLGTIAALIYRNNDIIIYSNKKILGRKPWKTYFIHGINLTVFVIMQFLYRLFFSNSIEGILKFLIIGLIMTVITLFVFLIINILVFSEFKEITHSVLKSKISKKWD